MRYAYIISIIMFKMDSAHVLINFRILIECKNILYLEAFENLISSSLILVIQIIQINVKKCVGCAYCSLVCPLASFKVEGISNFMQKCNKCHLCINSCPVSAIIPCWEE
ncbi:MAG: 4Fe-4S binding protein [Promethearchaeota archaeon]